MFYISILSFDYQKLVSTLTSNHFHLVSRSRIRGAVTPFPQYAFMVRCLVKHTDNFTFILPSYIPS